MTSIRASIASRATELRPTASSEKSRVRARFPLGLLSCLLVRVCLCLLPGLPSAAFTAEVGLAVSEA